MTTFDLGEATALLRRTPAMLDAWLGDLPARWTAADEGPNTWSPTIVLGHLIEGELHDWIPRARHLLRHGEQLTFPPFDRFAQLRREPRTLQSMLREFAAARADSLRQLGELQLDRADFDRTGRHPEFGVVTLSQHLATWVAHDLSHIAQIARVMAGRYRDACGPWRAYLRVLS